MKQTPKEREFKSDGCSGGLSWAWRTFLRRPPPFEGCCLSHDRAYWAGGTKGDRKAADLSLMACVAERGHPYWAIIMYIAVRLFGGPAFPRTKRWGYGHKGYHPINGYKRFGVDEKRKRR